MKAWCAPFCFLGALHIKHHTGLQRILRARIFSLVFQGLRKSCLFLNPSGSIFSPFPPALSGQARQQQNSENLDNNNQKRNSTLELRPKKCSKRLLPLPQQKRAREDSHPSYKASHLIPCARERSYYPKIELRRDPPFLGKSGVRLYLFLHQEAPPTAT